MQSSASAAKPAPGVVFDADIGNNIDGILALAVLYGLDTKNEARVVSVSVTKANLKSAILSDAIMRFYASGGTGQAPAFLRTLPIGFADDGVTPEDTKILSGALSRSTPDGKPLFQSVVQNINDTAECSALIRNALTAQHDENAIVILAGPATNLARVLAVPGAKDVIRQKVRYLVMAGGQFPSGEPEWNIATDVAAAKKVLTEWPTEIIA
jgi:inosine-uridine nucleoside N-ribohydrolase